jgi:hypothetical protein
MWYDRTATPGLTALAAADILFHRPLSCRQSPESQEKSAIAARGAQTGIH